MSAPDEIEVGSTVDRLGVRLRSVGGIDADALLGLALRRNPLRAQLLVSTVLGKHRPTDPRLVRAAGLLLGLLAADAVAGRDLRTLPVDLLQAAAGGDRTAAAQLHAGIEAEAPTDALVLGFAETATALGHCVAEALTADYLHSTRRAVPGSPPIGRFAEEHSHATGHALLPADPAILRGDRPLVLVDDELSTGRTALNTITALHRLAPRERYVLAALVDVRPPGGQLADAVAALGAQLDVVALASAEVEVPADVVSRAAALRSGLDRRADRPSRVGGPPLAGQPEAVGPEAVGPAVGGPAVGGPAVGGPTVGESTSVHLRWPAGLPVGGRHGFPAADHARFAAALLDPALGSAVALDPSERTLVLGTEELMHLPLRLAQTFADAGADVTFSTTTRSPAVVIDEPGYALRSGIAFAAHDDPTDGATPRYAYNLGGPHDPPWDHVVVVVDPPADTPELRSGLLDALSSRTRRTTVLVTP